MGQVILRRSLGNKESGFSGTYQFFDTYYIYDIYGNLTFVLPPKLADQIPSNGIPSQSLMDNLAYQYQYDHRNRVIHKKLPGKQKESINYDILDRVVSQGPVPSPYGDNTEGLIYTKYDKFDRVVYTLWIQGFSANSPMASTSPMEPLSETRIPGTSNIRGVELSYSNQVAPKSGEILTVHYYDDYTYYEAPSIPTTVGENNEINVAYNNTNKPLGMPTGTWTRVLETESQKEGVKSYVLYDKKARSVRSAILYPDDGATIVDTRYNFIGNPLSSYTTHIKDNAPPITIREVFGYTPASRLAYHTHNINNTTSRVLVNNEYNGLGQVQKKKVGASNLLLNDPLQIVDYNYNIRGWLTDINNVNNLNQPGGGPVDLFAFKINYDQVTDAINGQVQPLYNGNIAEVFWRTATDNLQRKYGYRYDAQNRLTAAYYQMPHITVPRIDSYSTEYSYDLNGNLQTLHRKGDVEDPNYNVVIDDLVYDYDDGNKLINVTDLVGHSAGFNDGNVHTTTFSDDFEYDDYGNLIKDRNKKIQSVTYNHLQLPVKITFDLGQTIEYKYLADGTKIEKTVTDSQNNSNVTEYREGFQYKNDQLEFFPHAEGYVKAVAAGGESNPGYLFHYVFNYTDHLGNIRLKYTKDPDTGQTKILEENHYYPFGLTHKGYNDEHFIFLESPGTGIQLVPVTPDLTDTYKYKFGGKEWQDELDLNYYDFGARNYDPALGRWGVIDPKADDILQVDITPYNYSWNNPVKISDPDGECPWCWGAVIGMGAEVASQVVSGLMDGKSMGESINDINYEKVAVAGVTGAATGGLSAVKVIGATAKIYKATAVNATVAGGNMAKQKVDGKETVDPKEMVEEVILDNIKIKSKNASKTSKNTDKTKGSENASKSKSENNNTKTPERSDAMKQSDSKSSSESKTEQGSRSSGAESSNSESMNSSEQKPLDLDNNNDLKILNTGIKL